MKRLISITIITLCALFAYAETNENRKEYPHVIQIGIADDLFIRSIEMPSNNPTYPPIEYGYHAYGTRQDHYRSTGHLFAEYRYRINHWLSVGANFNVRTALWKDTDFSTCPIESISTSQNRHHLRMTLMPTVRFSYFNNKYASLYASVGIGPYLEIYENSLEWVFLSLDVCYFGVSLGKKHWFCDLELGLSPIPCFLDRLFRASIGYRF